MEQVLCPECQAKMTNEEDFLICTSFGSLVGRIFDCPHCDKRILVQTLNKQD